MLNKFNVLLIEHDKVQSNLITQTLLDNFNPIDVEHAETVSEVLTFWESRAFQRLDKPDIIILNLDSPSQNGLEILKNTKKAKQWRVIPTIVLSGEKELNNDILNIYNLHANCFIQRPKAALDIQNAIKTAVNFWYNIVQLPSQSTYYQT